MIGDRKNPTVGTSIKEDNTEIEQFKNSLILVQ